MAILTAANIAFACGILGNIASTLFYLAPLTTFYKIYKTKSTGGFQSVPYSITLFCAMLVLYYAFLKGNAIMLITINSIGMSTETIYLIVFMIYATKEAKIYTTKLLVLFNFGALGLILLLTYLLSKGSNRVYIVGWIYAIFSASVFAAPLSIMKRVIKTKSVEFMPFNLSLFLTLCAIMWFFYGLLINDYFIAAPNGIGFILGITQMIVYAIYRDPKKQAQIEIKLQDITVDLTSMEEQLNNAAKKEQETAAADEAIVPSAANV